MNKQLVALIAICIIGLNSDVFCWSIFNIQDFHDQQDKGKTLLVKYQAKSDWSNCWKVAVDSMTRSCKEIKTREEIRSKLAIQLTNCHLAKSGLKTFECTEMMTVEECTKDMISSPIAFNAYTEFSTHVDQICFYIKSESFQEESERLVEQLVNETENSLREIENLKEQSMNIKETLSFSEEIQTRILQEQNKFDKALSLMKKLELEFYESLKKEFSHIHSMSKSLYEESKLISDEQSMMRQEVLNGFNHIDKSNQQLVTSLEQSISHSTKIRKDQEHTLNILNSFQEKQSIISDNTVRSMKNQKKLLKGQQLLQNLQNSIAQITSSKLGIIEKYTTEIGSNIEISMKNQEILMEKQKEYEIFIDKLKSEQVNLFKTAQKTLVEILSNSQETVQNINAQHEHVREILDGIIGISHNYTTLIGEFMDFKSFLFYFFSVIMSFLLTSTKCTSKARVYLLLLITVNYIIEKVLHSLIWNENIYRNIRNQLRFASIVIGAVLLLRSIFFFRDYSHMSYQAVQDLRVDLVKQKKAYYMIKKGSTFKCSKNTYPINSALAAPISTNY
ncbi:predicted protein [Naegleria gruberi]|uniref:Predicted protein n=1 Tax=Naegleria gruberi TaxID=5762 RepID=D2UXK4_NAEGR|nr:uncharacterized protein NAEGRDRAFT_61156 [Naegleria gruberi]EFC50647.1 predicted protein [Naegleria gruberi]|eukprot:XP_002683391.1 predicted protein [Naegleria gruberi strain NEG-M]